MKKEVLQERAAGRRINSETGEIYNLKYLPPPEELDAALLATRQFDDDKKAFRKRLSVFDEQLRRTLPLLGGRIAQIFGAQEPQVT